MSESARFDAVDVARGLALVAMAAYHFTWDLSWFGVIEPETPFTPPMHAASHIIGSAFLGLAGLSLALAHARGFRPRNFGKRLLRIGSASLVADVLDLASLVEIGSVEGAFDVILSTRTLSAAIGAGIESDAIREKIERVAQVGEERTHSPHPVLGARLDLLA